MIIVDGTALPDLCSLSEKAQAILALIDYGKEWTERAIINQGLVFSFDDERHLLVDVQRGLHDQRVLLIPSLRLSVSPSRLYSLETQDLQKILESERAARKSLDPDLQKRLAAGGLLSQSELRVLFDFLGEVGINDAALFQAVTLAEQIALFKVLSAGESSIRLTPKAQKNSATFALDRAMSVMEFADYYDLYMTLFERSQERADVRENEASHLLEHLLPFIINRLNCPMVEGVCSLDHFAETVQRLIREGAYIGFPRISKGALFGFVYGYDSNLRVWEMRDKAREAWAEIQNRLADHCPVSRQYAQDGSTEQYVYNFGDQGSATLTLDDRGCVALSEFSI